MSWVVVRVRSDVGVERSIKETMHMLNLTKVNHAVIILRTTSTEECYRKQRTTLHGEALTKS